MGKEVVPIVTVPVHQNSEGNNCTLSGVQISHISLNSKIPGAWLGLVTLGNPFNVSTILRPMRSGKYACSECGRELFISILGLVRR